MRSRSCDVRKHVGGLYFLKSQGYTHLCIGSDNVVDFSSRTILVEMCRRCPHWEGGGRPIPVGGSPTQCGLMQAGAMMPLKA